MHNKIFLHPCFARSNFGRIHLPVAPRCNIQCNYCSRGVTLEHRPGAYKRVLKPNVAVELAKRFMEKHPYITVIGVAGPGDPLYNRETFETFELIRNWKIMKCLCTNGLLLPENVYKLRDLGLDFITITINCIDAEIGAKIYSYVKYNGEMFDGTDGAEILIQNQLKGLKIASKFMIVKVNTVLIPGINDEHIVEVAKKIRNYAYIQNIIPLIPQYKFSDVEKPSKEMLRDVRDQCSKYVKQMYHCAMCRADSAGRLDERKTLI